MANFGQLILTNAGLQEQAKAQADGLRFKRIAMGSGRFSGNVMSLTKLVSENVSVDISKGYIQNCAYVIEGFFSNELLQTGFEWREIGVFVADENGNEVLYSYANAGDSYDFIPATEDERYSKYIRIATAIGNATNVTIVENEGITYVDTWTFNTAINRLQPSKSVSGEVILVDDSSDFRFIEMNIYGKSTQDGTPTPDAPVDIESVNNPVIKVCGANMLDMNDKSTATVSGMTLTLNDDGSIGVSGTAPTDYNAEFKFEAIKFVAGVTYKINVGAEVNKVRLYIKDDNGEYLISTFKSEVVFTPKTTFKYNPTLQIGVNSGEYNTVIHPYITIMDSSEFTPITGAQRLEIETPNGLLGIPVASGGNYTDKNGQRWVCDEIDFTRGVYIQRVTKVQVNEPSSIGSSLVNTKTIRGVSDMKLVGKNAGVGICNITKTYQYSTNDMVHFYTEGNSAMVFVPRDYNYEEMPIEVVAQLETPIETPLTSEQIAAYEALVTNNPYTTVLNDAGTWMKVTYVTNTFEPMMKDVFSHITNTNNPHGVTIEQIGAAPAGYGLGKLTNYEVYSDSEIDTVLIDTINSMGDHTFKRIVLSFKTTTNFTNAGGHYYTDIYKLSTNYATITIKSYIIGGVEMQRIWYAGVLNPWEWVNPPMVLGVEYRTTERYNGKVVYTALVALGTTANNAVVNISSYGATAILRYAGYITGYALPHISENKLDAAWSAYLALDRTGITIKCGTSLAGRTGLCQIWYTKD